MTIVGTTRLSEDRFWAESWLGRSVRARRYDTALRFSVAFENHRGLSEVYNRAIDAASDSDLLVFVHDDLFLTDVDFDRRIEKGLREFAIIGLVGSADRFHDQSCWFYKWGSGAHLSGRIAFPRGNVCAVSIYGPTPTEVKVLDGVLLAARAKTLRQAGIRFDERFAFHFYDLDFCRMCENAGIKMGTWPIVSVHRSWGAYESPEWEEARRLYFEKWGS